jgi:hypothetical protein
MDMLKYLRSPSVIFTRSVRCQGPDNLLTQTVIKAFYAASTLNLLKT